MTKRPSPGFGYYLEVTFVAGMTLLGIVTWLIQLHQLFKGE